MKIPLKTCPRMGCGSRMLRAYVRAPLTGQFTPHHWVCPYCGMTLPGDRPTTPAHAG